MVLFDFSNGAERVAGLGVSRPAHLFRRSSAGRCSSCGSAGTVLAVWLAVLVGRRLAVVPASRAPRELVRGARDGLGAGGVGARAPASASGPKERSRSSSASRTRSTRRVQTRLRARLVRAAHVLPGGRLATFRAGGGVVYGDIETSLGLQQREGVHARALRRAVGPRRARHRAACDPARPRPAARIRPAARRDARAAARAARARVRARPVARARDPVRLRRVHDRRHARPALRARAARLRHVRTRRTSSS